MQRIIRDLDISVLSTVLHQRGYRRHGRVEEWRKGLLHIIVTKTEISLHKDALGHGDITVRGILHPRTEGKDLSRELDEIIQEYNRRLNRK